MCAKVKYDHFFTLFMSFVGGIWGHIHKRGSKWRLWNPVVQICWDIRDRSGDIRGLHGTCWTGLVEYITYCTRFAHRVLVVKSDNAASFSNCIPALASLLLLQVKLVKTMYNYISRRKQVNVKRLTK